jgi:hypothetical protein
MAVYPVSAGAPDYSTGSSSQYIPAVYSALLIKKFYPKTLFKTMCNMDYEGDIKEQGDTVYIRTRPTIETFRYKKGMVLPVQNPESPYVTLKIDQGEGFSFAIDRVDEFQTDIDLMNVWADDATEQMKQVLELNGLVTVAAAGAVAGGQLATTIDGYTTESGPTMSEYTAAKGAIVNGGTTTKGSTIAGLGTSAASVSADTGDELTALILKYGRYLDENNAPEEGRYVVLPTWCGEVLKSMSSNNFGLAYATGQNSANLLTGTVPKIDRFDIHFSNLIPASTESATDVSSVIFGQKYGCTFATQITESRIIDNPFSFGKMMQGLQVYGFNIIKPQFVGVSFIKSSA